MAELALVACGKRRLGFEISAGQVIEQHIEGGVE
jgi:hypothetical protein